MKRSKKQRIAENACETVSDVQTEKAITMNRCGIFLQKFAKLREKSSDFQKTSVSEVFSELLYEMAFYFFCCRFFELCFTELKLMDLLERGKLFV